MEASGSRAIVDSVMQPRADVDDLEKMMDEMGIRRRVVCQEKVPREGPRNMVEGRSQNVVDGSSYVRRRRRWDDADMKYEDRMLTLGEESEMDQIMSLLRGILSGQSRIRKEIVEIKQAIEESESVAKKAPVESVNEKIRRCYVCESEGHVAKECNVPVRRVLVNHDKSSLALPRRRGKRVRGAIAEIVQAAARRESTKSANKRRKKSSSDRTHKERGPASQEEWGRPAGVL